MRRYSVLLVVTCLSGMNVLAQDKYFMINNDIYPCAVAAANVNAVSYADSTKTLTIDYKNGHCIWTTNVIESIDVTETPCQNLFSDYAGKVKIEGLVQVKETVPKDKTDPEYDDFIENFVRACRVTVTYGGNTASVTVQPSGYGVETSVKRGHVVLTLNDKKVQVIVKGNSDNGSLKIYSENKFRLDFENLSLTNPAGPAVNIQSKKSAYINLAENSTNSLGSGPVFEKQYGPDGKEEDAKATLFSEGQLLFSGSGHLTISNSANHGICSDDYIRFRSTLGEVTINSVKDAIHAKDHFRMYGGSLFATSGDNGVQVENGDASFFDGSATVHSTNHGISAKSVTAPIGTVNVYGQSVLMVVSDNRSAISCQDGFFSDGGFVSLQSRAPGSRCLKSDSTIILKNCIVGTELMGCIPAWNDESKDYTQPSTLRAEYSIIIENAKLYCFASQGTKGAKVLNANGDVVISNSVVNIESLQEDYRIDEYDNKAKALEGRNVVINNKSVVYIKSNERMISSEGNLDIDNSVLKLMSDASDSELFKCKGTAGIKGAVFYNKLTIE